MQNVNGISPTDDQGFATDMYLCRPTSLHPGVVNMSFCDGRTTTVSENIDYTVYCLLMTPDGSKCNPAGLAFVPTSQLSNGSLYIKYRTQVVSGTDLQ